MMMSPSFLCLLLPLALAVDVPAAVIEGIESVVTKKGLGDQLSRVKEMAEGKKAVIMAACQEACADRMDSSKCPMACEAFNTVIDKMDPSRQKRQVNEIIGIIDNVLNIIQSSGIFNF